ncbi:MAG: hypothetical protein JNK55_11335 [Rubrivivax sp.]|nr:hypothetical protein [Rubrivivax sp.]
MPALMLAGLPAQAQGPSPSASASAASAAPVSAAKKELVARLIKLHEPGLEGLGRTLAEQPVQQMGANVRAALARVPQDRREALARDLDGDVRRYLEDTVPLLRERAVALAPGTLGPILEQRFSEDELRQLIAMLESPVSRKYQTVSAEMQRAFGNKLVAETKGTVEPKLKALEQSMANRLRSAMAPASGAGSK